MERFYGFGQLTRPDIGLIADGVLNLAEIYTSDQRPALRNVFLEPEILDIIYNLSGTINREDLRSASGLEVPLLQTLDLQRETFSTIGNTLDNYISASTPIGLDSTNISLSGSDIKINHAILYSGAIHCDGASYQTKVLDQNTLTGSGISTFTTISTSRASLFNSEKNESTGAFVKAYLSDSIRVRRRSHVNRIEVNPLTFIPKPEVTENPTHKILCWFNDSGDEQASKKMQLLAVKNSPVRLPCRFAKGKITFTFEDNQQNFYGFKIQPLQTKSGSDVAFLPVPSQSMKAGVSSTFTLELDINATGYANTFDLYLYLYLNVEKVTSIVFEGIGVTDFQDNQDIGLVGFNNLERLDLSGTRLRYIPIWLKTLGNKIKELNFTGVSDIYVDGPFRFFDWRVKNVAPTTSVPLYTAISYLTIPKLGATINEDGDDWNDQIFRKYIHSQIPSGSSVSDEPSRTPSTDFREFSSLQSLKLGWKFLGRNPRLDDVFPDLRELEWYGELGTTGKRFPITGTPIKIGFPGSTRSIRYISYLSGASGTIQDIGTSADPTVIGVNYKNPSYIGGYRFSEFDVSGREDYEQNISGIIANPNDPAGAWDNWLENTSVIRIAYTKCGIDIQSSEWKNLTTLTSNHLSSPGGIKLLTSSDGKNSAPIQARLLGTLDCYAGSATGHLPSLGEFNNTSRLLRYSFGSARQSFSTFSYEINSQTFNYLLPENFAPARNKGEEHKLQELDLHDLALGGRLRYLDFAELPDLKAIQFHRSTNVVGVFPKISEVLEPRDQNSKLIEVTIYENCGLYDISALNVNEGNGTIGRDMKEIVAWGLNSSRGGCIAPDLKGKSDSKITRLTITGMSSYYPSSWQPNSALSSKLIQDSDPPSIVSNLTYRIFDPTELNSTKFTEKDIIEYFEGPAGVDLKKYVLVNDIISAGSSGTLANQIGIVLSVETSRIYIRTNSGSGLTDGASNSYTFYRQTQKVDQWFKSGFKELTRFEMNNYRLSGTLDITSGFSKITGEDGFRIEENGLTSITKRTFENIFSGSVRSVTLKLQKNNFSIPALKNIIQDLIDVRNSKSGFGSVKIYLDNCKLTNGSYGPYTREEIFPLTDIPQSPETIPLTSFITIAVYQEVISYDPDTGEPGDPTKTQVGTRQIQVKGKDVFGDGKYYTNQVNSRVKAEEDPLAQKWRDCPWDIRLDFSKSDRPSTSTRTISSTYYAINAAGDQVDSLTYEQFLDLNGIQASEVR